MLPHRFVMRPVGNNQSNPYFNPPFANPASPLVNYQVGLQVRQSVAVGMNPPYNPQMMHPMNTCPFPSGNPNMINPQYMGPTPHPSMNQQMAPMQNPSVNSHFPNMNGLPVPPMNCPPGMPHRPPNMPPVNLSQPIPNTNPQMLPPMNCQSFQSVNCQNIRPPMSHIPPGPPRPMPPPMQTGNPSNYPPNVPNVNYPNMPISNPQNGTPVRGQMNTPMVNCQNLPPSVNPENCLPSCSPQNCPPPQIPHNFPPLQNPQNFPPTINPQNCPPLQNPQNCPPLHNPQNIFPMQNFQTFPATVNPQNIPTFVSEQKDNKAKPRNKPLNKKQKEKKGTEKKKKPNNSKMKGSGLTIFWVDPNFKKLKKAAQQGKEQGAQENNKSNTLTNGPNKPNKENPKKEVKKEVKIKEEKKVGASKPNKGTPSTDSKIKTTPFITIKPKGDIPLDEKKTQYFKNLRPLKSPSGKDHGKKKLSENDKTKAKVHKIFSLMQKLKGVAKKLWQNVAANGEFKDSTGIREEVTKFCILSHKFLIEVDCIAKIAKKEKPASESQSKDEKDIKKDDKAPEKPNTESKDSKEASNTNSDQKPLTTSQQRKRSSIPYLVKLILKKLEELDDLGLCFVDINGIFVKRYCSVIIKLRGSLNALLEKSKTSSRKKRLKIPKPPSLPDWGAIMLTCSGKTTYEEALLMALKNIKFQDLGIQCIKQRRSVTGGVILEVFADKDHDAKTDKLMEKLKEIYASLEVRVTRPQKYGDLVVKPLDSSATVVQIREELAKLANCSPDVFKTGSLGKTCIWVRCPLTIAVQLDLKTIKLGSTVARINLKAKKLIRCYKCFNMGHVKHLCSSTFDHSNSCFKCGQKDHEARNCQNAPRCLTCYDNSLPACHRLGGEKCPSAVPKIIKWPTTNVVVKKSAKSKKRVKKGPKGKKVNQGEKIETKSISCLPSAPDQVRSRN